MPWGWAWGSGWQEMLRDGLTADNDLIVRGLSMGLTICPVLYPEDEMLAAIAKIEASIRTRGKTRGLGPLGEKAR